MGRPPVHANRVKPVGCTSTKVFLVALIMQCFIALNIPFISPEGQGTAPFCVSLVIRPDL